MYHALLLRNLLRSKSFETLGFERLPTRETPVSRPLPNSHLTLSSNSLHSFSEGVRFELTDPCESLVFKTSAIDRSATPPFCNSYLGKSILTKKNVRRNEAYGILRLWFASLKYSSALSVQLWPPSFLSGHSTLKRKWRFLALTSVRKK